MENQHNQTNIFNSSPQPLPNAVAVLILGVISIISACCYGIVGLICGIIAVVLGSKDMRLYRGNPQAYTLSSYNNLQAGRICGIIGLILSVLVMVFFIYIIAAVGIENLQDPEKARMIIQQKFG
ncbi:CCC motif membrane protein [Taibaiella soli]|uniref:DUF4190 domain-containing protein n=1 Tax=Taibaiella soli TaxID=1649169 RepID=A0A2W2AA07_9BACT|nr:CCC motif membrane protein [Taibaiella soli]PZF72121.1 hypothetical protein DN068_14395 [Taibaiella soli]